ncbi:MAG: flagellar protein FlaG [Spirochaetia bacterium]|uniref:flagellar protein FlaG n=1 Tax=Treponema berlinense TaxID=225004 RepID=UPI0015BD2041|nr:flagellar protein FlaG [Treponema berlinense]MDD5789356.1 flagellar protein FlaG [Spirochaetia bacterium]
MTISSIGQPAMDGRIQINSQTVSSEKVPLKQDFNVPMADPAQVVQNISDKNAQLQEDVRQLQKLSDVVSGRKVQFSVNKELNQVVVTVLDSQTDKVIKQIPSEDIQKLKVRIRKAIGVLFDEMI